MFFVTETKDSPKHVGALLLFERPEGAPARFVKDLVAAYRRATPVAPFDRVADIALTHLPRWVDADRLDMKYHVQHVALPRGATHADLLALVGELHSPMLDRSRPGFRVWFVDGLPDRRFALYLAIHHAMIDGISGMARIEASLARRARTRTIRPFYAVRVRGASVPVRRRPSPVDPVAALKALAFRQLHAFRDLYATLARVGSGRARGSVPFGAPRGLTNEPAAAGRSIATLALPLDAMRAAGKAFGGTLNDVAATIVDAGLVRYLADRGRRPDAPLVAMCPVSLRDPGDTEAATKVSAVFARLGTPAATIGKRMQQVAASLHGAKAELRGMSRDAAMLYALLAFGVTEAIELAGIESVAPPIASLVLSNIPGARHDLYLAGARLAGAYPLSALGGGIGLNVTLASHAGTMYFGFVGNAAALPDLAVLAAHTRDAFAALERAAARRAKTAQ
jgi:WS/DGAT/MGAT family acyltransferase